MFCCLDLPFSQFSYKLQETSICNRKFEGETSKALSGNYFKHGPAQANMIGRDLKLDHKPFLAYFKNLWFKNASIKSR